ncbi:uncharacterized protein LOC124689535 [Lolium rigidum]|uniref:uncharacterized protein LOC124689535 n=1 Tax=Lolium rigidum TaxID=89674 RepID=UPI001F5D8C45|nr:uncharacterized protein LOC124689535 [Lolium rigidum]
MGGGAADQGQSCADPPSEPAVLEQRHHSHPPRVLLPRHGLRPESSSLPIPDEILAEIFLRLSTPTDLIRASGACASFRRVAAGRSFVRRFRKLHHPPLLGFLDERGVFLPALPPYPSAPADIAADFSFSFLPAPARDWVVRDSRDGRVLLDRTCPLLKIPFREMVVCDPLHRRFLLLPPIPDDLAATVEDPILTDTSSSEAFLIPRCEDDEEETSFRAIWMSQCQTKLFAFVFSSNTGQWRAVPSRSWNDLLAGLLPIGSAIFYHRECLYGCFYWRTGRSMEMKMLVLDTGMMEFSIVEPLHEFRYSLDVATVEAGKGRLGMFVLADAMCNLSYSTRQNDGGGSSTQWQMEQTVSLGSGYLFSIIGTAERYLFLYRWQSSVSDFRVFAVDIKTFQLQQVCHVPKLCKLDAYINFPPSVLSLPTISSGVENEAEETLEQGCAPSSSA